MSNLFDFAAVQQAAESETRAAAHGPDAQPFEVVVVDERTWSALVKALPITTGAREVLIRHEDRLCPDYPAPCNCNTPAIHDGH